MKNNIETRIENPFRTDEGIKEHDRDFPKQEVDFAFERVVSDFNLNTITAISHTSRLLTRMKNLDIGTLKNLIPYIKFRINKGENTKALYYAYNAIFDIVKDKENKEKHVLKNEILDLLIECAQKLKEE